MKKIDRLRKETYDEAVELLAQKKKCAIIRPTGFGKTGILTKFIKKGGYKKILYLYPTDVVKQTVFDFYYGGGYKLLKNSAIPNVTFMTYMKLTQLTDKDFKNIKGTDLIICDEYHRIGATETMEGLKTLISNNKRAKLLGASATPDRMDMLDVTALFFDDITTSRYTLHDAIKDGIIKKPYYCYCSEEESDSEVLDHIKKDVMLKVEKSLDAEGKEQARELLKGRMIEIANLNRMENVIKDTLKESKLPTDYQKYIVFFSNFAHMKKKKNAVKQWFQKAFPKHTIKTLTITSETLETASNVRKLNTLNYRKNGIDLIFSCEMLNMGYHIGDLTGIVMYRTTYSNIIYSQQLGRALSTGDTQAKIVFDVVDNLHRKSIYSMLGTRTDSSTEGDEILEEYKELVKKQHSKNRAGNPIKLTQAEKDRLQELSKLIRERIARTKRNTPSKHGIMSLTQEDLIVTGHEATNKELIAKVVAEVEAMPCRQAWARWVEKGGDASLMTRDWILGQLPPEAVPLAPFCRAKNVAIEAVLQLMGVE